MKRRGPEEFEPEPDGLFRTWTDACGWCGLDLGANPRHDVDYCRKKAASFGGVHMPTEKLEPRWVETARNYLDRNSAPPILGETFEPEKDQTRLGAQFQRVRSVMESGRWLTLFELAGETGDPTPSVSARLRDLRRAGYTVHRRRRSSGTFEYRAEKKNQDFPVDGGPSSRQHPA